jgi:hypothetical protein
MNNKKILLLTLVHPDFLPPVYAAGQVLRDLGYHIHILTFDSYVPAQLDLGANIELETVGKHHGATFSERMKLRNQFKKRAQQIAADRPAAIISFCPFSFLCGLKIKGNIPFAYIALEIADFRWEIFARSPMSGFRNLEVLKNINKADFVATPSVQRSAWLAGRCHLSFMPYTILNTAYLPKTAEEDTRDTFKQLLPGHFLNKKIVLYTGAVNSDLCTMELVQAFDLANDEDSALVITGIKDNSYCSKLKEFAANSKAANRIKLFPYLTRAEMLALQSNADIGVCLTKEYNDSVKSKMIAPNKVGEYAAKRLYILGIKNEYLRPLEMMGIASLADSPQPADISIALKKALQAVHEKDYKIKISKFVKDYFCMQEQLKPLTGFISGKA